MKLIVGLGNPGKSYNNTRHNIGFMAVDNYLTNKNISDELKTKFNGQYVDTIVNGEKVIFLKPQKYMNLSGEVVKDFVNFYKIDINDILVINDDLDMSCGKIRLRDKGSSGGHNGLKNIENNLGTDQYKRLKIGINNDKNIDTKDYVLGKFTADELKQIKIAIEQSESIIDDFLRIDFKEMMNKYN